MAVETTYDCEPTLNDSHVLGFCKKGYLIFEGVVSDETNRKTLEFVYGHSGIQPTGILREKWFVDDVIKNPQAAGAVRSLLGRDFGLPLRMANHRAECPQEGQDWHVDGRSIYDPALDLPPGLLLPRGLSAGDGTHLAAAGLSLRILDG